MHKPTYARVEDGHIRGTLRNANDDIKYRMMKEAIKGYYDNHLMPQANMPSIRDINYCMSIFPDMGTPESAKIMWNGIRDFIVEIKDNERYECNSFFAIFDEVTVENEEHFQWLLWTQLQYAPKHSIDNVPDTEKIVFTPNENDFFVNIAGQALHVMSLHPESSRQSRRFPWPVLIFRLV